MTACTMEFMPVCDSNGITHGNKCAFDIAACEAKKMNMYLTMVKEGPCQGAVEPCFKGLACESNGVQLFKKQF